jgi:hypothetical protein
MSYSRNFGMRSFENVVRNGRFRVPTTGTPLKIGSPVVVDPANAGFMKLPAAPVAGVATVKSQIAGIVVFEHIQFKGVDTNLVTQYDTPYDLVPLGQYAQIVHGVGAKVWFKNTAAKTKYDGSVQPASTLLDITGLNVGDYLVPTGGLAGAAQWIASADTATDGWLQVEQYNPTTGLVEARFTF